MLFKEVCHVHIISGCNEVSDSDNSIDFPPIDSTYSLEVFSEVLNFEFAQYLKNRAVVICIPWNKIFYLIGQIKIAQLIIVGS